MPELRGREEEREMNVEVYGPCPIHNLWHDMEQECFECLIHRVRAVLLDEKQQAAETALQRNDETPEGAEV